MKQDITDRVRYEAGLIEARRNAEEMARTKNTLLNNISHELKTPLTAILGYSQLLVEEVPESVLELAEEVYRGGLRLQETQRTRSGTPGSEPGRHRSRTGERRGRGPHDSGHVPTEN